MSYDFVIYYVGDALGMHLMTCLDDMKHVKSEGHFVLMNRMSDEPLATNDMIQYAHKWQGLRIKRKCHVEEMPTPPVRGIYEM